MFLINLCLSFYGPALPFSHLSWEDMSIGEIIFKSVLELWEGTISKAPEIIINHLNEILIRSCVLTPLRKDQGPPRFFPDDILNDSGTIALAIFQRNGSPVRVKIKSALCH